MFVANQIKDLRQQIGDWKAEGYSIGFVPTMGNLHHGHIALVEHAQKLADKVVASIFVNPIQFDKAEDLTAYPRTLEDDKSKLQDVNTDLLFAPAADVVYPAGNEITRVEVPIITELLEGASRPGHFTGVATVVSKLFNMVQPDIAVFGEKDLQQLMVIRTMVADLNMSIDIIGLQTVRESDGLAMSSRNGYLNVEERTVAPLFYRALKVAVERIKSGEDNFPEIQQKVAGQLDSAGFKTDYIEIRRSKDLQIAAAGDSSLVILGSAWLGQARLIDNIVFEI